MNKYLTILNIVLRKLRNNTYNSKDDKKALSILLEDHKERLNK